MYEFEYGVSDKYPGSKRTTYSNCPGCKGLWQDSNSLFNAKISMISVHDWIYVVWGSLGYEAVVSSQQNIPQVDKVLRTPLLAAKELEIKRELLAELTRRELSRIREELLAGTIASCPSPEEIAATVASEADRLANGALHRLINGTGVILSTNLGRAPIPETVLARMLEVGKGYSNLEIVLDSGKRGERTELISELLSLLTGCEAALVVNNNASAVMLTVDALAKGKEVIVSRGELIEIGGSFRLPDVIVSAGGTLKEVGTTNRTRARDYADAISDKTGLILKCHRSNFEISGFTEQASLDELVEIGKAKGIPVAEDVGSGALFDISKLGLRKEPTIDLQIRAGANLVMFSGDKLLGGPQAGIIAGESKWLEKLRKSPMYRALRADKLIIAIIESVLGSYMRPCPETIIPALALASVSPEKLKERGQSLIEALDKKLKESKNGTLKLRLVKTKSTLGGGSLPGQTLDSYGLELEKEKTSAQKLARRLRSGSKGLPPVVGIISENRLIIDLRCVMADDEKDLIDVIIGADL